MPFIGRVPPEVDLGMPTSMSLTGLENLIGKSAGLPDL